MSRVLRAAARTAGAALTSAIVVLAVAGCTSPTPVPGATTPGSASPSATEASPSPSPTVTASVLAAPCTAVDVTLSLGAGGGGGAGHRFPYLVVTNDSGEACALSGHPTVTLVGGGGSGATIGAKAATSGSAKQLVLLPGKAAHAPLDVAVAENYDAASCQPQPADGFEVVLPGDKESLFAAASDYVGCANAAVKLMKVKAFVAGAK